MNDSNPLILRELVLKSMTAFIFQVILVFLVIDETISSKDTPIHAGTLSINCCRLMCAFLLHMIIVKEVRCALSLIQYAKMNPCGFHGNNAIYPYMMGLMKLIGGILAELVNMIIIVRSQTIYAILIDFIAMIIISEIDDMMAQTIKNLNIDETIDENQEIYF